jgi:hypothetical protein
MKLETIHAAIEEIDGDIQQTLASLDEKKATVNTLCRLIGRPLLYATDGRRDNASTLKQVMERTLADKEDANGKLPPESSREGAKAAKEKKAETATKRAGRGPSPLQAQVEAFVNNAAAPVDLDAISAHCKSERNTVAYQIAGLMSRGLVVCVRRGKSGAPGLYWKKGAKVIESEPTKPPKQERVVLPAPQVVTSSGRLPAIEGENVVDAIRRVVSRIPEPFSRADIEAHLPLPITQGTPGQLIGQNIIDLRKGGELEFLYTPPGRPQQYRRGPNFPRS